MTDGDRQGDRASHAVAEDVGLLDLQMPEERGDVVRHVLVGHGAVDVRHVSVPLQLHGDHLPVPGQSRMDVRPSECTVEPDQRPAGAVDLVIHPEAVHVGILALAVHAGFLSLAFRWGRFTPADLARPAAGRDLAYPESGDEDRGEHDKRWHVAD